MAKPIKKQAAPARPSSTKSVAKDSLLSRWEKKLTSNQKTALFISVIISLLFSVLLFDVRVSEMNDDSMYIEGGHGFAQNIHHLFSANAQLYPLVLSVPIKFFGVNLILLKSISVIFMTLHLWFFFLAFRNRVPMVVLIPVMLILAVNAHIQYFASLTFTEALFMFLQALMIWYFFKVLDKTKDNNSLKSTWFNWLMLGFFVFILNFCKNVALGAIVAIIASLLLQKRWLHTLYAIGGILLVRIPGDMIKRAIWNMDQFSFQAKVLQQTDPYNAAKGMETMAGFVKRFFDNTNLYIAKRLYQIFGFVSPDTTTTPAGLIFITVVLFAIGLIYAIRKKNNYVIMAVIYSLCMMGLTFLVLQQQWDQGRYVMVYVPFILLVFFYGIYIIVEKQSSFSQLIYVFFISVFFFSSFISSTTKAVTNFPRLKKNLSGDIYYGYTEDWVNFLKMSTYCADSLPKESYVASRKAPMSFIYGKGKKFFPVYNWFSQDADTVLSTFKNANVTHVIAASLRRNPKKIDGQIITTMQGLLQTIAKKYPHKLMLVKQIGETEPAYLYEIKY